MFSATRLEPGKTYRGVIGLDGGSTSSKCVFIDENENILKKVYTLSKGNPIQDMKDTLHSLGFCRYAGNSDSALFLYPQDMKALFPDSQYVLIKRDVNEVLASSRKLFPVNEKWLLDVAYPKLVEFEKDFKPLVVKYEDLGDVETCLKIWEHCIPTVPFNFTRWSMLDRLKVEINDKEVKKIGDILCQQCG